MVSGEDTSYNEASSIANLINTSEIYYAYGIVYWNVDKPFARALPTTVFQVIHTCTFIFKMKYKQTYNLLYSAIFLECRQQDTYYPSYKLPERKFQWEYQCLQYCLLLQHTVSYLEHLS